MKILEKSASMENIIKMWRHPQTAVCALALCRLQPWDVSLMLRPPWLVLGCWPPQHSELNC
jgi:hypothetical protein